MGDADSPKDQPTPLMRVVLALVTATTTLFTAGPVILLLGTILAVGLFTGAAYALTHTGGLEPGTFKVAHRYGVAALVAFFVTALVYREVRRDAKGILGAVGRRPIIAAAVALPVLSLGVIRADWNHAYVPALSGMLILDDLYFFSIGGVVLMAIGAVFLARTIYCWAATERYRAGLVTGAQALVLGLLSAVWFGASAAASAVSTSDNFSGRRMVAPVVHAGGEGERQLLVEVDALLEPGRGIEAAGQTTPSADEEIRACIAGLIDDIDQVQRSVGRKYRLSDDDAHDIVRDALLNVCNAHLWRKYTRLGAALQRAAENRAIDWARYRARLCELDERLPSCFPTQDESVRYHREDVLLVAALCEEDPVTQRVIRLWVQGFRFRDIGAQLGLTEAEARWKFNNAIGRMRKSLADTCP
jgi:DNA-directed RNA polymerase specialized sigma24 family protein